MIFRYNKQIRYGIGRRHSGRIYNLKDTSQHLKNAGHCVSSESGSQQSAGSNMLLVGSGNFRKILNVRERVPTLTITGSVHSKPPCCWGKTLLMGQGCLRSLVPWSDTCPQTEEFFITNKKLVILFCISSLT